MKFSSNFSKKEMVKQVKNRAGKGMSLVEIVVGAAIIMTAVVSLLGIFGGLTNLSIRNTPRVQAAMLLDEGAEVLRLMRDAGWHSKIGNLANGTTYRLLWQNSAWTSTTTATLVDGKFDRTFVLSAVNRDATTYDIVTSGGSVDTGTRKATISVAWNDGSGTTTKSVQMYIYDTFSN